MHENKSSWMEHLRLVTPLLITVAIFLLTILLNEAKDINDKLFRHLTNDEIHTPKSIVVTKAEFTIYQQMRDRQMSDIRDMICDVRNLIERGYERQTVK